MYIYMYIQVNKNTFWFLENKQHDVNEQMNQWMTEE